MSEYNFKTTCPRCKQDTFSPVDGSCPCEDSPKPADKPAEGALSDASPCSVDYWRGKYLSCRSYLRSANRGAERNSLAMQLSAARYTKLTTHAKLLMEARTEDKMRIRQLEEALITATRWGVRSDGHSSEVSDALRNWIDNGMKSNPPRPPSYYPGEH